MMVRPIRFLSAIVCLAGLVGCSSSSGDDTTGGAGGSSAQELATLSSIQSSIMATSCSLGSSCHGAASPAGFEQYGSSDGSFTSHDLYTAIVGVASTDDPSLMLVVPGHPEESFLVAKIQAAANSGKFTGTACDPAPTDGTCGTGMPMEGIPLTTAEITRIQDWITAGALDN